MPRSEQSGDATSVYSFTTEDTATSEELARRGPKKYNFHKRFAYQKLEGWRPVLTPRIAELFFLSAGVLLLALGIPILIASLNVVEYKVPYAFEGPFAGRSAAERQSLLWSASDDAGVQYTVPILVEQRMEPPIYLVFELGSFFQNFRRYVRSYDPKRMHDGADSGSPVSACQPFSYLGGNASLPVNPCGQIANNFFNDTFRVLGPGGELAIDDSSIAWPSDANHLYGPVAAVNYNPADAAALRGGNTTFQVLNQNQHWMVWMRPHSQVAVQKLYGRIDTPIEAGTQLSIEVQNRYNTYEYSGAKTLILTTNSWVGGRNNVLGACYIAVGGLCLIAALFFVVGYDMGLIWKRPFGDLANLSWLRSHASEIHTQRQLLAALSSTAAGNGTASHAAASADGHAPAAQQVADVPPSVSKN